ncbi:MAG: type IX secretion system sortase PorU [Bacteroidales bacterium]|nr:type IX secretion system sortase PorU [Bacteroidales bacterium]MBN2757190.1 type IX secretion system sortase PorU [Bacteroidales bacterium]
MSKKNITILLLLINTAVFSQNISFNRKITWTKKISLNTIKKGNQDSKKYVLNFKSAVYDFKSSYLPKYFENINVYSNNIDVSIENIKYENFSELDLRDIIDLNKVSNKINVYSKVFSERKNLKLSVSFVPIIKSKTGKYMKISSFDIVINEKNMSKTQKSTIKSYSINSVLKSGKWVKIKIKESGIYKITFDELTNLGINNPENVRIFGNGGSMLSYQNSDPRMDDLIENHILIENNSIFFYGDGPIQWEFDTNTNTFIQKKHLYSDYSYYFLSSDYNSQTNNLIQSISQSSLTKTHNANSFTDYNFHEIDSLNLIQSGRLWVGEHFDFQTEYEYNFDFPNIIPSSTTTVITSLLTRSPLSSSFIIQSGTNTFSSAFSSTSYNNEDYYANQKHETFTYTNSGGNSINTKLTYNKSTSSSEAWLDYFIVNCKRSLSMYGSQMAFRNVETVGSSNITEFTLSNAPSTVKIWDITNPQQAKKVLSTQSGNNQIFKLETNELREFIAFDGSSYLSPIFNGEDVGIIQNQNLHGILQTDMLIVCPAEFIQYASQLKSLHETTDNLNVTLATTEQIYNEFSSGAPDVSAIRDLMKMFYDRANTEEEMPKYLLLFGDGSYDNKHINNANTNFILTYQSESSLHPIASFVTDDFFGLLDDDEGDSDGFLDIGIGRLPVSSAEQAQNAVNKIQNYISIESYSNWRNQLCFIADDEDDKKHIEQADELTRIVRNNYPVFNIEKVYIDAYKQESTSVGQRYPDVNQSINNLLAKGLLIFNYTGHGGENGLAEERIITIDQITKWENKYKLPIFITATCEFSRFDNYEHTSAGEQVFLNPTGGAIALFTTTRLVLSDPNFDLNKNFYSFIFENNLTTNKRYRLGDVVRLTKVATGTGTNKRNFTLLGDPAISLSYAYNNIVTTSVNGIETGIIADTLKAYEKVTIKGEIRDYNNQKISNYNGIVYPSVYDKEKNVKTLNNDNETDGVFDFTVQNNIIFKGKASVINGEFQFSFIVPKDIRYNVDTGKISYYASNNLLLKDAKGYDKNILIGGSSDNAITDEKGPEMEIYFNDESFVSGGITNDNPALLLFLKDESGINTTGNGIGHDIVATIDDDIQKQFILNDYYESNIDDYTSGTVNYNFSDLETGEHKLKIKAWDVYNNSAQDSIIFIVTENENFKIKHVLNYPNPFSTNTSFFFEHNRPNELLEILIQVFSVSGKLVKTIKTNALYSGFRSNAITWDSKDDFGNNIGRGVYFYKLSVRTQSGERTNVFEKLLKL